MSLNTEVEVTLDSNKDFSLDPVVTLRSADRPELIFAVSSNYVLSGYVKGTHSVSKHVVPSME